MNNPFPFEADGDEATDAPPMWWTVVLCIAGLVLGLGIIAGALALLVWVVKAIGRGIATAGSSGLDAFQQAAGWLTQWDITQTITNPVHAYLHQHAAGLPASPQLLWWAWLGVLGGTFVLACLKSNAARIGWTLMGGLTVAMVWAGTASDSRALAAGIAAAAWAVLSVLALRGIGRRQRPVLLFDSE